MRSFTARSGVFRSMLADFKACVPLTEYDGDLVMELLRFIYKFEVKDLAFFALDLLPLTNKVGAQRYANNTLCLFVNAG